MVHPFPEIGNATDSLTENSGKPYAVGKLAVRGIQRHVKHEADAEKLRFR